MVIFLIAYVQPKDKQSPQPINACSSLGIFFQSSIANTNDQIIHEHRINTKNSSLVMETECTLAPGDDGVANNTAETAPKGAIVIEIPLVAKN